MAVPEADGERGDLLYEPPWSRGGNRFNDWTLPVASVAALAGGLTFAVAALLLSAGVGVGLGQWYELLVPVVLLLGFGVPVTHWVFTQMPFRVYERGVEAAWVSLREGIAGDARFVPYQRITKVTIAYPMFLPEFMAIRVDYERGGRKRHFSVTWEEAPGIEAAAEALCSVVPHLVMEVPSTIGGG